MRIIGRKEVLQFLYSINSDRNITGLALVIVGDGKKCYLSFQVVCQHPAVSGLERQTGIMGHSVLRIRHQEIELDVGGFGSGCGCFTKGRSSSVLGTTPGSSERAVITLNH